MEISRARRPLKSLLALFAAGAAVLFIGFAVAERTPVFGAPTAVAAQKTQGQKQRSPSAEELRAKYAAYAETGEKIRVLIVPGHEPDYGGAQFVDIKERDLVVPLAGALAATLSTDPHFDIIVARDANGWAPELEDYFDRKWKDIQKFVTSNRKAVARRTERGFFSPNTATVEHNAAPDDVAYRLFGITKWADEHKVDLAIHVHLNDAPGHGPQEPGAYSGFVVYVPDPQFSNGPAGAELGSAIAARLNAYHATSTLTGESAGVVEDPDLIALGSADTASFPSVLVEYAYIYEPQFLHPETRAIASADYAFATYLGIRDFLDAPLPSRYGTSVLPRVWGSESPALASSSPEAYALQAALHRLGYYPPAGEGFMDCPVSGLMGPCTANAVKAFQKANGLEQTGALGPRTRALLQQLLP